MPQTYVRVIEEENDDPIELPGEDDGTLLLTTLQAQYPGACGLKFVNPETKAIRGIRLTEGRFYPPSDDGWGTDKYFCVFPKENKRKCDDNLENSTAKTKRLETRLACTDLIVLGLPWKTTEEELRDYFKKFGELLVAQVKKDTRTGQSKGFGFIRFESYEVQKRVLSAKHVIDGRKCEVKIPSSKGIDYQVSCKVFVGRLTENINSADLREYFTKFGEVTDVFIPKPFRGFGFVTFLEPEVAQSLCDEDHIIKGVSVNVTNAEPKVENNRRDRDNYNDSMSYRRGNSYGGYSGDRGGYGGDRNDYNGDRGGSRGGFGGFINRYDDGYRGGYNDSYRRDDDDYMSGSSAPWNERRSNLDMPNLQNLGINSGGKSSSNSNSGLNLSPAVVAAALSQLGAIGNMPDSNKGLNAPSWSRQSGGKYI